MKRTHLKLAIVAADLKHQALAARANRHLPRAQHLSELNITQLVTCRKAPTAKQESALARVLGRPVAELFPLEVTA
jgi:hypothetical protein